MAKGTTFGHLHSNKDLQLIQQSVEVSPAKPKTNYVQVPGADGSKDLTEVLGVGVKYEDREIKWTFALYPGDNWANRQRIVSGALNGLACHITLDDDPDYYYDGRVEVTGYKSDSLLKQITVRAVCRPYKLKQSPTTVVVNNLTTEYKQINIFNDRKPAIPIITATAETTLLWQGASYTVSAGTHKLAAIRFTEGTNVLKAKTTNGAGSITIVYQEGAL